MRLLWKLFAVAALFSTQQIWAAEYFEDDRSMGSDVTGLPHYRSPEEACVKGVLIRKVQAYQEGDNRKYRYRSANVGTDDGFSEYACQGVIERQFYYPGANWVTVETVATNVYGPFGAPETCTLGGYQDPETGQCGPPKCTDSCCDSGCGNGSNPIGTASGNKHQVETDFVGTGPFPLVFTRTYDSKRIWLASQLPIGVAWSHRYLGQIVIAPPQGSSTLSEAVVYRPDGRILRFNLSGGVWRADADVPERLAVTLSGGDYVSATLTTTDDEVESYDQLGRLSSITNRGGFIQTLNYTTGPSGSTSTISHNFVQQVIDPQGRTLTFNYNSTTGQLSSLTDGNNVVIQYGYDGNNNLQTVTYPDVSGTKVRTYFYNETGQTGGVSQPNALTGIQDENTQRFASWGYTNTGLANLSVHGAYSGGTIDRTSLAFNSDGTTTVTDGLGQARKFTFGVQYLVARYSVLDTPCDYCGSNFASRGYDANGYPNAGTDFRSYQTTFAYAATDATGHARGLETQRDEGVGQNEERVTNTTWNTNFRVPDVRTVSNHSGTIETQTKWVYNSRGQPLARCAYDLTQSGASSYVCSATGTPPAGIRRWTYIYCDAIDSTQCPLVGLLLSIDGPRTDVNDTTTYAYRLTDDTSTPPLYRKGDLWTVTNALNQATEFQRYDGNGRPLRIKDVNSILTDLTYHPRGWMRSRTVRANADGSASANDAITQVDYDGVGSQVKITQPDGAYLSYGYDNAHRLTDVTDNLGDHGHYTLNALGQRTGESTYDPSNALKRSLSRQYDALDRYFKWQNASSATVQMYTNPADPPPTGTTFTDGYDGNGNAIYSLDGNNVGTERLYDALNRLKKTLQDHTGISSATRDTTTQYSYDTRDNTLSVTDPDNLATTYTYDGLNDLNNVSSPDTGNTGYTYDAAGNRVTQTDARNVQSTYVYDALNRLLSISYPTTSLNVTYSYDQPNTSTGCSVSYPTGRLTQIADSSGTTTYCYDLRGNILTKTQVANSTTATVSYTYSLADRLSSITYPSGAIVTYGRDSTGRVTSVTYRLGGNTSTLISNVTYYPFGPPNIITYGNGRTLTKTYDQDYAIDKVVSSDANGLVIDATVDVLGNVVNASSAVGASPPTRTYAYDPLYHLLAVTDNSNSSVEAYTYNATGDRLSKSLNGSIGAGGYVYSSPLVNHHLQSVDSVPRSYDANGNTAAIGNFRSPNPVLNFTFDDRNRLSEIAQSSGCLSCAHWTADYNYNGRGQRVSKIFNTGITQHNQFLITTTTYAYGEAGQLLDEIPVPSSTKPNDFVYLDSVPVGYAIAGTLYYVEADQLGTPRTVIRPGATTAGDSIVWKWDYFGTTFGEDAPSLQTITFNQRFPGQYFDAEAGFHYNYFRDYEPATGRYIESDPVGLKGGTSTYGYVRQTPLVFKDPIGLFTMDNNCPSCSPQAPNGPGPQINSSCKNVPPQITNVALRSCIEDRCRTGKVTIECPCPYSFYNCPKPGDPATSGGEIHICYRHDSKSPPNEDLGDTAIHEWGHSCNWTHGDGMGIPHQDAWDPRTRCRPDKPIGTPLGSN